MLVDVQDMSCVLAVFLTATASSGLSHSPLWPRSTNLGWTFSACGWTSGSTVYTGTVSLAMCKVTASVKAVHRGPFFSYETQWLNDSANVGCFLAGVCGLVQCPTVIHASVWEAEIKVSVRCLQLQQPVNKLCSGLWSDATKANY